MSGSTIGGVVGGVVGFFFGVPQLGYAIGSIIGGAIDPEEIRGPSIGDAQRQTSLAGAPRPVVYGHPAPFMGNIIDGEAKARKITQTEGGKGGPEVTTERFILTSAIRICEGPIAGVLRIWRNDQLVFDRTADGDFPEWSGGSVLERAAYIAALRAKTNVFNNRIAIYFGDEAQLPDPTLEAIHGVGNTPYYRGTAYIVIKDDDVTDMRGAAALWKFEVLSEATEGSLPTTVPNVFPAPSDGSSGGVNATSFAQRLFRLPGGAFPSVIIQPLMRIVAARGVGDAGDAPIRARVLDQGGAVVFDTGWMGNPAYIESLRSSLHFNGRDDLMGPITNVSSVAGVFNVSTANAYFDTQLYRGGVAGGPSSSAVTVQLQIPDAAFLPDSVMVIPEYPDALLGSDGQLYYPAWATPSTLTTLSPGDVFLGPVVADIASRCGLLAANLDVSPLATDVIPGFLVAQQGPGADCLRPTQSGFFYDLPEYDKKIRAIKRGASTVADITEDDILDSDNPLVRPQEVQFPRLVSVVTQDPDANYAPIPQTSMRFSPDVNPTSEVVVSLAIPFRSTQSKQIADKLHKVLWAQAEGRIELPLPENFSVLVPSDCITFSGRRWLIEQTDYADGQLIAKAVYDRAAAYGSVAVGQPATPPTLPSTGLGGPTLLEFLNLPILSDLDDRLGFYVAVSGVKDGWRGAIIQTRLNDGDPWTDMATVTTASVMGNLLTELPNASWDVIDYLNTVTVDVNGSLSSITLEQLLNEQNGCVIGEEICQFMTADLLSDDTYDLSTLTRGRLNTATAAHAVGTRFVLLNAPVFIEAPSTWIGQTIQIRAVTIGTVADNNPVLSVMWQPAYSQTEWPPVAFIGTRDTSNNVGISWVGQGRLGSNKDAKPSQFLDGYQVTITKGAVSKIYTTINQSFPYSAVQQTADFGSATGTLTISIVAMNRITGASAALIGSIP